MQGRSHTVSKRSLLAGLLLAVLFVLLQPGSTRAATVGGSYTITMTPSSTELHAPPDGTTSSSFGVVNEGKTGYNMTLSVAPYRVVGDDYNPQFTLLPGKTDASKWIHFNAPSTQYLAAGQTQNISYTLDIPPGTAPGGYYAVIFAENEPPPSRGVISHNRVGDILYITVDGPVLKQGSLLATQLPHLFLGSSLPLSLIIRDTGGLHFLTTVNLDATSATGRTAFQASLQRYVLPQTQRLVTTTWVHVPLFGLYKINRSAVVAGQVQTLPAQWVVFIRPWLLIPGVLVVLGVVTIGIKRLKRHCLKPQKPKNEKTNVRH